MRLGGPSNPYHIARAYGPTSGGPPSAAMGAQRLVAAKVSGGVDFTAARPPVASPHAAYPMYTHPADRNAAATGVALGRQIDIAG